MFSWLTSDQLDFISEMAYNRAESWVEKKYPEMTLKEKKAKIQEIKVLHYRVSQVIHNLDGLLWEGQSRNGGNNLLAIRLREHLKSFIEENKVGQAYLMDAVKWFGHWSREVAKNCDVEKDLQQYEEAAFEGKAGGMDFRKKGPLCPDNL